jgi:hypothetical protein
MAIRFRDQTQLGSSMGSEKFDPAEVLPALFARLKQDQEGDPGAAGRRVHLVTEGFVDLLRVKTTGSGATPHYIIRVRPMESDFAVSLRQDGKPVKWRQSVPFHKDNLEDLYKIVNRLIESEGKRLLEFQQNR